jgi:phosphomannomutase
MKRFIAAVIFAVTTTLSVATFADGHTTLRVVTVSTNDVAAYVAELGKGKQMMAKLTPKMVMRAWQATFAGTETGTVIVSLEYPGSTSAFATAWEKTLNDKNMADWLKDLGDLRELVSDSLYRELSI